MKSRVWDKKGLTDDMILFHVKRYDVCRSESKMTHLPKDIALDCMAYVCTMTNIICMYI